MIKENLSCMVDKEHIPSIKFSKTEVLEGKQNKSIRAHYLNRAAQLGNLLKNKVNIYFMDANDKLMRVNTTIWAITTNEVILKQGVTIPRNRVVYVD